MPYRPTVFDQKVFETYVPSDHHLRKALELIDWDAFHDLLAPFYSENRGQPSEPPTMMLQLEYLRYHYNLSDCQVIERGKTDIAFRLFLQVDSYNTLPDPSSLCRFRARLKTAGFRQVFDQVVAQARQHNLVKERLRLKDATHIIANIDVPSTLGLVAQIRDQLLAAAEPFDAERVAGERVNIDILRERTEAQKVELRLEARVTHLKDILHWVDDLPSPENAETNKLWQKLVERRRLAHRILDDQEHPTAGDKVRSVTDSDARRSKHGDWFDGYLLDIIVDPDSEIITQIDVLPANGEEAANAIALLLREEAAHGNDVDALSIDGIGFNGPVLRELEDTDGLDVDVYVPPRKESEADLFTLADFQEVTDNEATDNEATDNEVTDNEVTDNEVTDNEVTDNEATTPDALICPAGHRSTTRYRDNQRARTVYRFDGDTCRSCPLLSQCMKQPPRLQYGRVVCKSDYHAEHERARAKATTEQYRAIRREHWKVERKLGEIMNCHGGRRARSRGHVPVFIQECMASTATNIKRVIKLLSGRAYAPVEEN